VPDWFRDAKFGIWAHFGPQSQPAWGDWYARLMYVQGRQSWMQGETAYEHHLKHYGHPSRTGFIDIIGQWKAERWRPEELINRYKKAGARYFMALGCHHDNLDLFASRHHEWNSVRVGPKRDVLAAWAPVVRDAGLRFGISNHSGHAWHWYQVAYGYDAEGPMRGRHYDAYWLRRHHGRGKYWEGLDPQELYVGPYYVPPDGITSAEAMNAWHDQRDGQWLEGVPSGNQRFVDQWLLRQKQMVEDYRPDIMYLDHARVPFGDVGLEAIAHYYSQAAQWHGSPDVVVTSGTLGPFEERALVSNVERGFLADIHERPWQTATCIGNWYYSRQIYEQNGYKSAKQVVQRLVDTVSKNGNLLLNIPVRGDGTIDDKEEAILDQIAAWTARNGEAIFGTRPWRTFGEGPTRPQIGEKAEDQAKPFTAEDVRFTQKGGALYAIFLDSPEQQATIRSIPSEAAIERVELLGGPPLPFQREGNALRLRLPAPDHGAFVPTLRILGRGLTETG
jgi:alpha-L-fucosidase